MLIGDIACVCHEAIRAICESQGDMSRSSWGETEPELRQSCVESVLIVLDTPGMSGREMHRQWKESKIKSGWKWGEVKDSVAKTHPCICEYDVLPESQRLKCILFINIVNAFREAVK